MKRRFFSQQIEQSVTPEIPVEAPKDNKFQVSDTVRRTVLSILSSSILGCQGPQPTAVPFTRIESGGTTIEQHYLGVVHIPKEEGAIPTPSNQILAPSVTQSPAPEEAFMPVVPVVPSVPPVLEPSALPTVPVDVIEKAPPFEERSMEEILQTDFGTFFQKYIQDAAPELQEQYLKALPLFFRHQRNGQYIPSFNERLYQEGLKVYINFETVLPTLSRSEARRLVEEALDVYRIQTSFPVVQIVDSLQEANIKMSMLNGITAKERYPYTEAIPYGWAEARDVTSNSTEYVSTAREFDKTHDISIFFYLTTAWVDTHVESIFYSYFQPHWTPTQHVQIKQKLRESLQQILEKKQYQATIIHEIGHFLGADHTDDITSIMFNTGTPTLPVIDEYGTVMSPQFARANLVPDNIERDGFYQVVNAARAYLLEQNIIEPAPLPVDPNVAE